MYKILIAFLLVCGGLYTGRAYAGDNPIPNNGFETWTGTTPTGWFTNNAAGVIEPVYPSGSSYEGNLCLAGEVKAYMQGAYPPQIFTQTLPYGFAVNKRYEALTGFLKYTPVGGDVLTIGVVLTKNGNAVGGGEIAVTQQQGVWKQFIVDINYSSSEVPDRCMITFGINNLPNPHVGSIFHLDKLEFAGESLFSSISTSAGAGVISQKFPDLGNAIVEGADDFTVPVNKSWRIEAVEILGSYSDGGIGFQNVIVNIRADDNNKPGALIHSDTTALNNGPNFFTILRNPVQLNAGHYWLNFYVTMPRGTDSSYFAWATTSIPSGSPFHWRDPANIFGNNLLQWVPGNQNGIGGGNPALMFEIVGEEGTGIGITPVSTELPSEYLLSQNYPNPFNPETYINFGIPKSGFVNLTVYNSLGQQTAVVVNEHLGSGSYKVSWNASRFPSGAYYYKIQSGEFTKILKMMLIK